MDSQMAQKDETMKEMENNIKELSEKLDLRENTITPLVYSLYCWLPVIKHH
jgi:hypothetical protein